ncbi:unnamed protein product [Pleuronectes platessa]|uniref:Uncharacterized protein n=1 Tax=Pleuronectes platessa TaxID=8262 RepID=A0A9N7Z4M1_PLEPL|nr:unnamed protein product [Pleuronectes platessa]
MRPIGRETDVDGRLHSLCSGVTRRPARGYSRHKRILIVKVLDLLGAPRRSCGDGRRHKLLLRKVSNYYLQLQLGTERARPSWDNRGRLDTLRDSGPVSARHSSRSGSGLRRNAGPQEFTEFPTSSNSQLSLPHL